MYSRGLFRFIVQTVAPVLLETDLARSFYSKYCQRKFVVVYVATERTRSKHIFSNSTAQK